MHAQFKNKQSSFNLIFVVVASIGCWYGGNLWSHFDVCSEYTYISNKDLSKTCCSPALFSPLRKYDFLYIIWIIEHWVCPFPGMSV